MNINIKNVSNSIFVVDKNFQINNGEDINIPIGYLIDNPSAKHTIATAVRLKIVEARVNSILLNDLQVESIGYTESKMYSREFWDDFEKPTVFLTDYIRISGEETDYAISPGTNSTVFVQFLNLSTNKPLLGLALDNIIEFPKITYANFYFGFVVQDFNTHAYPFVGIYDKNELTPYLYLTVDNGVFVVKKYDGSILATTELAYEIRKNYIFKLNTYNFDKLNKTFSCDVVGGIYTTNDFLNIVPLATINNIEYQNETTEFSNQTISFGAIHDGSVETGFLEVFLDFIGFSSTRETVF